MAHLLLELAGLEAGADRMRPTISAAAAKLPDSGMATKVLSRSMSSARPPPVPRGIHENS